MSTQVANLKRRHPVPAARMVTTPAGITIGIAHTAASPNPSRDAETLQTALLDERTKRPLTGWQRFFGFLWRFA